MAKRKSDGERKGSRHVDRHMVSLPGAEHEALRLLAERNGRPITWELKLLVRKHLESNGLWPPAEADGK